MHVQFCIDWECLDLLPTIALSVVKCDSCDDLHGIMVSFGWLVAELDFIFPLDTPKPL